MVQVHEAVGGGHGQGFFAIVADHLLPETPLFDGVGSARGESASEQEQDGKGQSGHGG